MWISHIVGDCFFKACRGAMNSFEILHLTKEFLTCTDDTSVLTVCAVMLPKFPVLTVAQRLFASQTGYVIEPHFSRSMTETCRSRGLRCRATTQLSAHHLGIIYVPAVITDCSPGTIEIDFNSSRALVRSVPS